MVHVHIQYENNNVSTSTAAVAIIINLGINISSITVIIIGYPRADGYILIVQNNNNNNLCTITANTHAIINIIIIATYSNTTTAIDFIDVEHTEQPVFNSKGIVSAV